jgi:hypothetical protein
VSGKARREKINAWSLSYSIGGEEGKRQTPTLPLPQGGLIGDWEVERPEVNISVFLYIDRLGTA